MPRIGSRKGFQIQNYSGYLLCIEQRYPVNNLIKRISRRIVRQSVSKKSPNLVGLGCA